MLPAAPVTRTLRRIFGASATEVFVVNDCGMPHTLRQGYDFGQRTKSRATTAGRGIDAIVINRGAAGSNANRSQGYFFGCCNGLHLSHVSRIRASREPLLTCASRCAKMMFGAQRRPL